MKINKNPRSIIFAVVVFVVLYLSGALSFKIALGSASTNTDKAWRASFKFLQGNMKGFLTPAHDRSNIIIKSNLAQGEIIFSIYDPDDHLIGRVRSNNQIDTIQNLKKTEVYRIEAAAKRAKGNFEIVIE